jgi:hypothetical protein
MNAKQEWDVIMDAKTFYENLKHNIEEDRQHLGDGEEIVGYYYAPNGKGIAINDIGYFLPDLIWLHGFDEEENSCTVLLHFYSVHIVLKRLKDSQAEEPRTIGFRGSVHGS